jgi:hypothetical protein
MPLKIIVIPWICAIEVLNFPLLPLFLISFPLFTISVKGHVFTLFPSNKMYTYPIIWVKNFTAMQQIIVSILRNVATSYTSVVAGKQAIYLS